MSNNFSAKTQLLSPLPRSKRRRQLGGFNTVTTAVEGGARWGSITGDIESQGDLKEKLDERPTSELFKRLTGSFVTPPPASEMQEGDICFILTNVEAGEE